MSTDPQPIDYQVPPDRQAEAPAAPTTVQPLDVSMLWTFAILAILMSLLFLASVPLCIIALVREPDVFVVVCLLCAVGMTAGLGGTGIGLIRRARRGRQGASDIN